MYIYCMNIYLFSVYISFGAKINLSVAKFCLILHCLSDSIFALLLHGGGAAGFIMFHASWGGGAGGGKRKRRIEENAIFPLS